AIDRVRSRQTARKTVRSLQADQATPNGAPPLDQVSRHEQHQVVKTALDQLSESQRQVLKMAYYDGLTQAVIAERLDTPLGTIKARARRGLIKLRQLLQDPLDRQ
ncbi:MAG: sigma-70 family RNA polymerase sigma factor, partial [Phormidesmis sp.]